MRKFVSITADHMGRIVALDNEGFVWTREKQKDWYGGSGVVPMVWYRLDPPAEFAEDHAWLKKDEWVRKPQEKK